MLSEFRTGIGIPSEDFSEGSGTDADETCSVTNFLANGIPDYPINGATSTMKITGSTKTYINQLWLSMGSTQLLGHYSHTTDGVSYYTNGDEILCPSARQAQITWSCGSRHMELISIKEPKGCEYHFKLEVNCCQGMTSFFLVSTKRYTKRE